MKKTKSYFSRTLFSILLAAILALFPKTLLARGEHPEILLSVDYVEPNLEIPISPDGGTATLHIISYGGIPEETLLSNIQSSLEALSIEWITNVYLTNKEGIYEADLNFDISSNFTDQARELIVSASNGSSTITQDIHTPNVYNLLPNTNPVYLLHGGKNALILSSSDGFAAYRLLKDTLNYTITIADMEGKSGIDRQLKFIINSPGTYYCVAYYPTEVQMNGTKIVDWHPFYDSTRTCSLNPNPYTFPKDGGSVSFTYDVASAQDSILQRIVNLYNRGDCTTWDTTMVISYTRNPQTANLVTLIVEAGPNLKKSQVYPPQPNTITNNTYFKTKPSGNEIIFTQPADGEIKAYSVSFPGDLGSVPPYLILDSTQHRVKYALFKDGIQYGPSRTGHGDSLHLAIPADSGKFTVMAFYAGQSKRMKGSLTVTGNMKAVWGDNWILKQTFTEAESEVQGTAASNLDITYYDGLGYPTQIISVGASPQGKNIITPVWYDPMRREDAKAYLPYASSTSSTPQPETEPFATQETFYTNLYGQSDAQFAFTEKVYESSPLNRVQRQYSPGEAFRASGTGSGGNDHYTAFAYEANAANEVLDMVCNESGELSIRGYLSSAKLFKTTVTSPDGRTTTEFKDSEGTLFLQRSGTGNSAQETYYAYDSRRRLRWVIQPEGSSRVKSLAANSSSANPSIFGQSDSTARKFCFIYNYDGKGQMTEKRIPGKGFEYMVYDPAGRLVATQDSILRSQNHWILTRYDSLSRVTGTYRSAPVQRAALEAVFQNSPYPGAYTHTANVTLTSASFGEAGNTLNSGNLYSADIPSYLAFSPVSGVAETADIDSRTASLLLYDKTLSINTINSSQNQRKYRERAYYYDTKGRVIQTVERNPDGETLRTSVKYDFTGNPLITVQTCSRQGNQTLKQTFEYDSRGRKVSSSAKMNSSANTVTNTIAKTFSAVNYTYDELGRLTGSDRGKTTADGSFVLSPSATTPVLSTSLNYNIQGWMTTQADVLKKGTSQSDIVNLYSQTLRYHDAQITSTTKSYDGLITEWETTQYSNGTDFTLPGSTEDRYTYAYSYDSFGRLTQSERFEGTSGSATNAFSERNLSFDRNGNILTLTRYGNGNATIKDNFTYSYDGNRLKKFDGTFNGQTITHTEQNSQVPGTADYIYDGNGNMTLDALRNIALTYDINNLVSTVSRNDTLLSTYFYLADGTKYKVVDKDNKGRAYIGPFSYALEKIGNTVFSYLEGIDTDGGRIMVVRKQNGNQTTADYTTAFFVKDHLGSTRVMLNAQGDILERNAYYPFGLQMNQGKAYPTLSERLPQLYTGYISPTPPRRDLYNGKELQITAGTDYLDYGFRQYDQTIARWFNIDPKAEKYLPLTPYSYCSGNPISLIDIKGSFIGDPPGAGYYKARVNTRYVGFGVRNPVSSIRIGFGVTKGASDISTNATRFATRGEILYGSKINQEDRGSENGAFRHALWQASITSELGYSIAKQAGNAHEENPFASLEQILFDNLDEADQAVDLNNNEIGRIIGVNNSGNNMKELAFIVLEEFRKNGLYTAKKEQNGNWKVVKTILTQEKYEQLKYIFSTLNENGRTASEQQDADMKSKEKLNSLQLTWGTMK
ncbi:MAG: RHS repeat protein [Bacteroidales bacterium]|nr:RHS repeat protein [Bacteroidales bacterium]